MNYNEKLDHHSDGYDPVGWAEHCEHEADFQKEEAALRSLGGHDILDEAWLDEFESTLRKEDGHHEES